MMVLRRWCALGVCCAALGGCSDTAFTRGQSALFPAQNAAQPTAATAVPAEETVGQQAGESSRTDVLRKIVFHADVDLVCDDFSIIASRLESLTTAAGGFIADAYLLGAAGQPRQGEWKLRVPSDRFGELLSEVKKLAEVRTARTTADDVSAEYYDVEARIRNKQQEETRLLRLLDDRTAKLDEVLSVEREISRVRGEVEQMQATLRVLTDLTDLATITVRLEEVQGYRPETAASFPLRLARSVRRSFESLLAAVQAAIIGVAMAIPWLLTLIVPLTLATLIVSRSRTRRVL